MGEMEERKSEIQSMNPLKSEEDEDELHNEEETDVKQNEEDIENVHDDDLDVTPLEVEETEIEEKQSQNDNSAFDSISSIIRPNMDDGAQTIVPNTVDDGGAN